MSPLEITMTIIGAIFASTGFWSFIQAIILKRSEKDGIERRMLKGLAHNQIYTLGKEYIAQGYITQSEYENLHDYLYVPYHEMGGNGTGEKIMAEVDKLPLREDND